MCGLRMPPPSHRLTHSRGDSGGMEAGSTFQVPSQAVTATSRPMRHARTSRPPTSSCAHSLVRSLQQIRAQGHGEPCQE